LKATDLSPDLLEYAKEKVVAACPQAHVEFEPQDVMRMTLPEASFDSVFGCSMLHHVDPKSALQEIHRVLKPGGWCTFSEPNMLNPQIAVSSHVGFIRRRAGYSPDETAFFRWELERLLQETGYAEISVRNFDFLHPSTPRPLISTVAGLGSILEKCPGVRAISGSLILCARKA
jgi:ubiquinone/menaquinone biosynthesis C-methylase UbiE